MLLRFGYHTTYNGKAMLSALVQRKRYLLVVRSASSNSTGAKTPDAENGVHQINTKVSRNLKQCEDVSHANASAIQGLQGKQVHDFSPAWNRDVQGQEMAQVGTAMHMPETQSTNGMQPHEMVQTDTYQHSSNVSLYSVMQSQVPDPYAGSSPTHLNMPCGGETQQQKYISGMLHDTHPSHNFTTMSKDKLQESTAKPTSKLGTSKTGISNATVRAVPESSEKTSSGSKSTTGANTRTEGSDGQNGTQQKLSQKDQLKRAVKEYGATVVVFHIGISLMSLGGFYVLVSSGIDVVSILQKLGVGESILSSRIATGASTFVIAYAVHKVFVPVRIAITLTATPFIVRYLRMKGILKAPKIKR